MNRRILDTFCAHEGIISVVGAGGKKTTMYRLAAAHTGRIAITSTVYTPPFRRRLNAHLVLADAEHLTAQVNSALQKYERVAYAQASNKPARLRGVSPQQVADIHRTLGFDATLVKADGARLRWVKAPDQNEPVVPSDTSVLIPVLSIRAIGKRLSDEIAHRVKDVAHIMKIQPGDRITATHLARLLSSEDGALKSANQARVIPVINMVESKEEARLAKLVAEQAMGETNKIDRVVIASMAREDPVLHVVQK